MNKKEVLKDLEDEEFYLKEIEKIELKIVVGYFGEMFDETQFKELIRKKSENMVILEFIRGCKDE